MSASTKTRQRNARGQGVRLREEIVDAATRLIDAGSEVTLRAVAREAGISAPSIYDHFADVEQILAAVVARCFEELTATIQSAQDAAMGPVERLEATCRAYLSYCERRPARYSLLFRYERPATDRTRGVGFGGSGAAAFETLVESVADCAAAGRSASTDPFADAVALWSGLHGLATLRATRMRFPWPDHDDTARRIIHHLGRITDPPPPSPAGTPARSSPRRGSEPPG